MLLNLWNALRSDESGQDLAEYALLIALIAIVVIAAVTLLGGNINTVFTNIAGALNVGGP
ncbi:MAG TPA: Flp family type IVb pilin [Gemmatimonadota bacterium]|jgi:pilus assembly protein Flp/PilA|nr:Flp family type IVb pilin [Gemmatimonadota bacterium]